MTDKYQIWHKRDCRLTNVNVMKGFEAYYKSQMADCRRAVRAGELWCVVFEALLAILQILS